MPVKISTVSHHMTQLRLTGLVSTRLVGTARPSRLREDDLDGSFRVCCGPVLAAAGWQAARIKLWEFGGRRTVSAHQ